MSRRSVVIARVARRTPKATVTTTVFAAHVAAHGIEAAICTTRIGNKVTARIALAAQRVYVAMTTMPCRTGPGSRRHPGHRSCRTPWTPASAVADNTSRLVVASSVTATLVAMMATRRSSPVTLRMSVRSRQVTLVR